MSTPVPTAQKNVTKIRRLFDEIDKADETSRRATEAADTKRWDLSVVLTTVLHEERSAKLQELADQVGRSGSTLSQIAQVGKEFKDTSTRYPELSFNDHMELRRVQPSDRPKVIEDAKLNEVSIATAVRRHLASRAEPEGGVKGDKPEPKIKTTKDRLIESVDLILQHIGLVEGYLGEVKLTAYNRERLDKANHRLGVILAATLLVDEADEAKPTPEPKRVSLKVKPEETAPAQPKATTGGLSGGKRRAKKVEKQEAAA